MTFNKWILLDIWQNVIYKTQLLNTCMSANLKEKNIYYYSLTLINYYLCVNKTHTLLFS